MEPVKVTVAANITYNGTTFNTKLHIEYEHTGKIWYTKKKGNKYYTCTESPTIAKSWQERGFKVIETPGYYFMKRLAIPTVNANCKPDIWYINNPGDYYSINKVSKYAQKIHEKLTFHVNPHWA